MNKKVYIVLLDENEPYDHGRTDILAVMSSRAAAEQRMEELLQVEDHMVPAYGAPFKLKRYRAEYLSIVEETLE